MRGKALRVPRAVDMVDGSPRASSGDIVCSFGFCEREVWDFFFLAENQAAQSRGFGAEKSHFLREN